MANPFRRIVSVIFDRDSAKKVEGQLEKSLTDAGKKGGDGFLRELKAAFAQRMADLKVQLAKGLIDSKTFKAEAARAAKEFNTGLVGGMEKARAAGKLTNDEYLKLSRNLKRVGDDGASAGSKLGGAFARAGAVFATAFSVDKLVRFFRESLTEALDFEASVARLESALGALGMAYRDVEPEAERFLTRIQETTRFSDDDAREALTRLVTITGDYEKSLGLLDLTANIAEKRQISMADAAQVAGDASLGLTRGMRDLGIQTGETGDIVGKLRTNLGNLAEEAGGTNAGKLARFRNGVADFKETLGLAILGSTGLTDSSRSLLGAFEDLNTWVKNHSGDISRFVDHLVSGAAALAKLSGFIIRYTPNLYTLGKAIDWVRGRTEDSTAATVEAQGATTAALTDGAVRRRAMTEAEQRALARITADGGADLAEISRSDRALLHQIAEDAAAGRITLAKEHVDALGRLEDQERNTRRAAIRARQGEIAAELTRINRELATRLVMQEQGLTRDLAAEYVRRQEVLTGTTRQIVTSIEEGWRQLDASDLLSRAGLDKPLVAKVTMGARLDEPEMKPLVDVPTQVAAAQTVESVWVKTLHKIGDDLADTQGLFARFAESFADEGIKGVARLAGAMAKQAVANSIRAAAQGLFSLFSGNPGAAAGMAVAAAKFQAEAAAWRTLGGLAGGGSRGGGGSGSAGAGLGTSPASADRAQPPGAEVHIHLDGPGFDAASPVVQRVVYGAMQQARERYGENAQVILHRRGS